MNMNTVWDKNLTSCYDTNHEILAGGGKCRAADGLGAHPHITIFKGQALKNVVKYPFPKQNVAFFITKVYMEKEELIPQPDFNEL